MADKKPIIKNSSIKLRLFGVVVFLVITSIGVGGLTYYGFSRSETFMEEMTDDFIPRVTLAEDADSILSKARRYEKEFFLFSSLPGRGQHLRNKQNEYHEKLVEHFLMLGERIGDIEAVAAAMAKKGQKNAEMTRLVAQARSAYTAAMEAFDPLVARLFQGASFLDVAQEYDTYKKHIRHLEGDMQNLRVNLLAQIGQKKAQVDQFNRKLSWALLGVGTLVIVLGPLVGFLFATRLSTTLDRLRKGFQAAGAGNIEEIEVPRGNDEFSEMARTYNETLARLKGYLRTEKQREEEQMSLIQFLEVVSEASEGDLTAKAPVTADAFGSIADAYNLMIESLADLLNDTQSNAREVGAESRHLLEIFHSLEQGADNQVKQVRAATEKVDQTSATSQEIARKTHLAQQVSGKVDEVTGEGNQMAQQNIEGMQLIRVTVQVINKRMKSLSERLLEIGTISQLISEVATRTTILAMNASIEASRAGEQGRGFLVISDEIKRLADKSAEATKQIGGIIKAIQTEAGEVTAALEEETRTVETQTRVAQQTGEAFLQIQNAIGESKNMVTEMFELAQQQERLSGETVESMDQVSGISSQALQMVRDSARITAGLVSMSENLLESMAQFRLPAGKIEEQPEEPVTGNDDEMTSPVVLEEESETSYEKTARL